MDIKANKLFNKYLESATVKIPLKCYLPKTEFKIIGPVEGGSPVKNWSKNSIETELFDDDIEVRPAPVYAYKVSSTVVEKVSQHYTNKFLDYWFIKYSMNVEPNLTLNDFINLNEGLLEESD